MKKIHLLFLGIALGAAVISRALAGPVEDFDESGTLKAHKSVEYRVEFKGREQAAVRLQVMDSESPGVTLVVTDDHDHAIGSANPNYLTPVTVYWTPSRTCTYVIRISNDDDRDYQYTVAAVQPE